MMTLKLASCSVLNQSRLFCSKPPSIKKSFEEHNPVLAYCQSYSTPLHPALRELQAETLKMGNSVMMGAPEVLSLNMFLMRTVEF